LRVLMIVLPQSVVEYGCGQGKLAELVLTSADAPQLDWCGFDQSPLMVERARERLGRFHPRAKIELLESGAPEDAAIPPGSVDRFVSTYVLDLLSERDMFAVLDQAQASLHPERGILLLAGITWGYTDSWRTFFMTLVWELLYRFRRKMVGGCRPQQLEPYLKARGWTIVRAVRTLPSGFPWMTSEVIAARPPRASS
jgi:SAM-dependent methyltransferase